MSLSLGGSATTSCGVYRDGGRSAREQEEPRGTGSSVSSSSSGDFRWPLTRDNAPGARCARGAQQSRLKFLQAGGRRCQISLSLSLRVPFFLLLELLTPHNVTLNSTLEASASKGEASCACATTPSDEKERKRRDATLDSNTNYRLPCPTVDADSSTRRFANRYFGHSGHEPTAVYPCSLFAGSGIHGHARLSLESRSFSAVSRARPGHGTHSPRTLSLWGDAPIASGVDRGVDHAELTGGHSSARQLFRFCTSRIDFFSSSVFSTSSAAIRLSFSRDR